MSRVAWGILGTGAIARTFAADLAHSNTGRLVAVASRSAATAHAFVANLGLPGVASHGSYEGLLGDRDIEGVYVATPHSHHAEWAIKAAEAGKHLLVEKPLGMNAAEVEAIIDAAGRNGVFLMEGYMYRCHPQIAKLREMIEAGTIGDVRLIQASFGFHWPQPYDPAHRLLDPALGGGAILDVGGYPLSLARLVAGAALGKPFAEPARLHGLASIGQTGVDEWAVANLEFDGGILAELSAATQCELETAVRIFGSKGSITLPTPWSPGTAFGEGRIVLRRDGGEPEELLIQDARPLYAIEADSVAEALDARESPAMSWADSLGNARALDLWRQAVGMTYPAERDDAFAAPVARRIVSPREPRPIPRLAITGLEKPVSRLALGVRSDANLASVLMDAFYEQGGNTFDTAWWYGEGECDRVLGRWMASRGCRAETVVIAKGAHTPMCDPEALTRQLMESLDFLQTDYVDIYCMHRDNEQIPVAEFVEVLNEHHRKGRFRIFGASNWTLQRVDAFNSYAKERGLHGFSLVSNNYSLARMVDPVWPGCVASSEPAWRAWHERTLTPDLAWSSQARGFFANGDPASTADPDLVRSWYSDDNFERLSRARQLAAKYGVTANNIALAWVLQQAFPTVALIGPANLAELRSALPAVAVTLSEGERRWLNLEAEAL